MTAHSPHEIAAVDRFHAKQLTAERELLYEHKDGSRTYRSLGFGDRFRYSWSNMVLIGEALFCEDQKAFGRAGIRGGQKP